MSATGDGGCGGAGEAATITRSRPCYLLASAACCRQPGVLRRRQHRRQWGYADVYVVCSAARVLGAVHTNINERCTWLGHPEYHMSMHVCTGGVGGGVLKDRCSRAACDRAVAVGPPVSGAVPFLFPTQEIRHTVPRWLSRKLTLHRIRGWRCLLPSSRARQKARPLPRSCCSCYWRLQSTL